jgi:hypothetical protein
MTKHEREYDPLNAIPSVEVLESRLAAVERLAKRLRIVLGVARRIEATERLEAARAGKGGG